MVRSSDKRATGLDRQSFQFPVPSLPRVPFGIARLCAHRDGRLGKPDPQSRGEPRHPVTIGQRLGGGALVVDDVPEHHAPRSPGAQIGSGSTTICRCEDDRKSGGIGPSGTRDKRPAVRVGHRPPAGECSPITHNSPGCRLASNLPDVDHGVPHRRIWYGIATSGPQHESPTAPRPEFGIIMQDENLQQPELSGATGQPADTPTDPQGTAQLKQTLSFLLIALGTVMMVIVIARMLRRSSRARHSRERTTYTSKAPPPHPDPKTPRQTRHSPAIAEASAASERLDRVMADAEELTRRLAAIMDNKAARIEVLLEHADQRLAALAEADSSSPRSTHASSPARQTADEPPAPLSIDPLHRKVYDLADQGMAPVDIARQIDRPTGQIELILSLRRA